MNHIVRDIERQSHRYMEFVDSLASEAAETQLAIERISAPVRALNHSAESCKQLQQTAIQIGTLYASKVFIPELTVGTYFRDLADMFLSNMTIARDYERSLRNSEEISDVVQRFMSSLPFEKYGEASLEFDFPDIEPAEPVIAVIERQSHTPDVELSEDTQVGSFVKKGKTWLVEYGGKAVSCENRVGFVFIMLLLRNPKHEFFPLELRLLVLPCIGRYNYVYCSV